MCPAWAALEEHPEGTAGPECGHVNSDGQALLCPVTRPLRELRWLPASFWAQFTVLVVTYKGLRGMRPSCLKGYLPPAMSARPVHFLRAELACFGPLR